MAKRGRKDLSKTDAQVKAEKIIQKEVPAILKSLGIPADIPFLLENYKDPENIISQIMDNIVIPHFENNPNLHSPEHRKHLLLLSADKYFSADAANRAWALCSDDEIISFATEGRTKYNPILLAVRSGNQDMLAKLNGVYRRMDSHATRGIDRISRGIVIQNAWESLSEGGITRPGLELLIKITRESLPANSLAAYPGPVCQKYIAQCKNLSAGNLEMINFMMSTVAKQDSAENFNAMRNMIAASLRKKGIPKEAADNFSDMNHDILRNQAGDNSSAEDSDAYIQLRARINELYASIGQMHAYGAELNLRGVSKGATVTALANELQGDLDTFWRTGDFSEDAINTFRDDFTRRLNSRNEAMREYRVAWGTIIKNIAIALVPVLGVLAIIGKLIHSKATEGRALFFGQRSRTTSEDKVDDVSRALGRFQRNAGE